MTFGFCTNPRGWSCLESKGDTRGWDSRSSSVGLSLGILKYLLDDRNVSNTKFLAGFLKAFSQFPLFRGGILHGNHGSCYLVFFIPTEGPRDGKGEINPAPARHI